MASPGATRSPALHPVVGFDLDMTLVDSSAGIAATLRATLAEHGVHVGAADVDLYAGLPLDLIIAGLAPGTPPAAVDALVARYRQLYPSLGVDSVTAYPGAAAALAAPRAHGGRSLVVSAKHTPNVHRVLAAAGLDAAVAAADVAGDLFADAKGPFVAAAGGTAYVGDHPGDVAAARAAGAVAVAVTTGAHDGDALRRAGADVVLAGVAQVPAWLEEHVLDLRTAALRHRLAALGSVLVVLTGTPGSALLLAEAAAVLGPDRVAAAVPSPAPGTARARALAAGLGIRVHELPAGTAPGPLAARLGLAHVAGGQDADEVLPRPGSRSGPAGGDVATPLRDAALTGEQVRAASRRLALPGPSGEPVAAADVPAAARD
ncbi:haloacid dehalogenase-like hydrolase [Kineococcus xinjiangensis]|uniref:haloacid dehalogenase-like hydrolase n=1 Tax=Kineococcus xinjiangensis TaxID=512762 RepID=UPI001B8051BC|nr:HAD hydrolase-like protein [Kineococcus xinjiangensis]